MLNNQQIEGLLIISMFFIILIILFVVARAIAYQIDKGVKHE